jgi:signal transduction histidine kinase
VRLFLGLPFLLKFSRDLYRPTLLSFCTLTSVSVFGSFFYGGVSSPFLPWFLTAQLLGFFYLSHRPLLVLGVIGTNLAGFSVAYHLTGLFPERVPVGTLSTVGTMSVCAATIYNSMMAIYYAYIMVAQSALQRESKNHIQTLLVAKREAEDANEAKAVFLAKMSHQLRTPLNAIIGYSEILLEDTEASGQTSDVVELTSINKAGRHLLSLVSDVLHMPKIDSEDMSVELLRVDLEECLDEVIATCRNLISQNGNSFVFDMPQPLGMIHTDERRLRQILINLLGNAGKFTKNGTVTLRAQRAGEGDGEQVLFSVKDTGIGIAPESLPKLFKNFNQVDSEQYGGSGLGLAVSQRLAQLLSGEISVQSQPHHGSEFTLCLPLLEPVDVVEDVAVAVA